MDSNVLPFQFLLFGITYEFLLAFVEFSAERQSVIVEFSFEVSFRNKTYFIFSCHNGLFVIIKDRNIDKYKSRLG